MSFTSILFNAKVTDYASLHLYAAAVPLSEVLWTLFLLETAPVQYRTWQKIAVLASTGSLSAGFCFLFDRFR
ncbi:hypothetical protein V1504DRAFT_462667 [Lipomyces starkeyi]